MKSKLTDEIVDKAHIKWLSKAETAIIKGSEMTVLPYGYLSQAVREAISQTKQELIEEIKRDIYGMGFKDSSEAGQFAMHTDGYNQAIDDILEKLSNK